MAGVLEDNRFPFLLAETTVQFKRHCAYVGVVFRGRRPSSPTP